MDAFTLNASIIYFISNGNYKDGEAKTINAVVPSLNANFRR